eukprot:GHUV01052755.1.p1 GENE.GHUV01052755.1~~GHUV01052755.1.p1  ORF type:complete len:163 (-),score=13.20 GHUV01052755.1:255-743(-)
MLFARLHSVIYLNASLAGYVCCCRYIPRAQSCCYLGRSSMRLPPNIHVQQRVAPCQVGNFVEPTESVVNTLLSSRSGKLQVLSKVLAAWHAEGHKVLLFTQTQQMLDIIEKHAVSQGYSYHRMDGGTAIAQRGRLMDDFNTNPSRLVQGAGYCRRLLCLQWL